MSMDQEDINPYDLLGLTLEANEAEIRTAYRQRSLKVHPDRVSPSIDSLVSSWILNIAL